MQKINHLHLELSTVQEFAVLAKKAVSTVYTDLSSGRAPLPEVFRFTPTSRPLFVNAAAWLDEQIKLSLAAQVASVPPLHDPDPSIPKKRGRPSHASKNTGVKC